MAQVLTNIALTADYVPYERPPDSVTLWSAIPRGLQSFFAFAAVDIKPINDNQIVTFSALIPPNFGYVMNDMNVTLASNRALDFDPYVNLNLQNFYRAPQNESVALAGNWVQGFPDSGLFGGTKAISVINPWPAFPFIGTPGTTGAQISIQFSNGNATATLAGTTTCMISFWVFDLEQIRKYPINSPIPTHAR